MRTGKRLLSLLLCGAILFSLCFPTMKGGFEYDK
ncbi:hypothetical protein C824_001888 [Schaedlerella arabinosiphila]|nr:hypothetical protein C824_001888 [Schaedlerella arabinosiphila]